MGANEKHAATCHGGQYTPNTGPVRNAYAAHLQNCYPVTTDALSEFDRWLEQVRAEAKAEALREAAENIHEIDGREDTMARRWLRARANQYKEQS